MNKFSISAIAFAAALALPPAASADSITFTFTPTGSVTATNTSISTVKGVTNGTIFIQDTNTADVFEITGNVTISSIAIDTGAGGTYVHTSTSVTAVYEGGSEIEITSAACVGGLYPGVCLIGDDNSGVYSAITNSTKSGSFGGGFVPTYVSPYITSLFPGDADTSEEELALLNSSGSGDSYLTKGNAFTNSPTDTSINGTFNGTGTITDISVLSGVPEPSSLMLLGTGLLGLAGMLHRKQRE